MVRHARSASRLFLVFCFFFALSNTAFATVYRPTTPEEGKRVSIARNPETSATVLRNLARDDHPYVRRAVAKNRNTPQDVLRILSTDLDIYGQYFLGVRPSVAENPNTPVDVLHVLAEDPHRSVRKSVARNPDIPIDLLRILTYDHDPDVRLTVAANSRTPSYILCHLEDDSSDAVRERADGNLSASSQLFHGLPGAPYPEGNMWCWYKLGFVDVSPADLRRIAGNNDALMRQAVADHVDTPVDVLRILANDSDTGVRISVARNPNTPTDVLRLLTEDGKYPVSQFVRFGIAQNPNVTLNILRMLERDSFLFSGISRNRSLSVSSLEVFFSEIDTALSRIDSMDSSFSINTPYPVLHHSETSINMLRFLAQDPDFTNLIAKNPRAPLSLLRDIALHSDSSVRKEIVHNLNTRPFPVSDPFILQLDEHSSDSSMSQPESQPEQFGGKVKKTEKEAGKKSFSISSRAIYLAIPLFVAGISLTIIFHPSFLSRKKKRKK